MEHLYADLVIKGNKSTRELKQVLIDTGATYTVLPQSVLEEVGASLLPTQVDVALGNGSKVKAKVYGIVVTIEGIEAPTLSLTFENAQTVIGVETLESIGLKLDPTTGKLEVTRPQGMAYFF